MLISKRLNNTKISAIRKLTSYAVEAQKNGIKIHNLNIGQPDIATPIEYFEALSSYNEAILSYGPSEGLIELRKGFSEFLHHKNIEYSYDEIFITNGGSEALFFIFLAVCDEGEEIIVPEPYYSNYGTIASSCGVKLVPFKTKIEDGFHIKNKQDIQEIVTEKTRAILYSNPCNPTGTVYSFKELEMVAEVAYQNNIYIISDEVYREFIYDDKKYDSIFSIDKVRNNLILIDSLSKRYSVCGSRIGMIASKNKNLMNQVLKLCQARLCISTIEQYAATKLLKISNDYIETIKCEYQKRRDTIIKSLSEIDGVEFYNPEGAFYLMVSLPVEDAEKFCIWLLQEFNIDNETVMFAPGSGFYFGSDEGKNQIRISYCVSAQNIVKAMNILKIGLQKYKNHNK